MLPLAMTLDNCIQIQIQKGSIGMNISRTMFNITFQAALYSESIKTRSV